MLIVWVVIGGVWLAIGGFSWVLAIGAKRADAAAKAAATKRSVR